MTTTNPPLQILEADGFTRYGIGMYVEEHANRLALKLQHQGWDAQTVPTDYEAAGLALYAVYYKKDLKRLDP